VSVRSPFPPLDEVLTGLDLGGDADTQTFDVTMGRRPSLSGRDPESAVALPELAVALAGPSGARDSEQTDLQIAELIGRGGMGEVWLARQRSLGRDVALKTTQPEADARVEHALVAEARITGALEHPSIVPVHALGRAASGQPVLVMKRIEGVAWRDLLREPDHPHWATLGPDEPLVVHVQILMQLCNALELAHRRGFVHRDVKPANVMVGSFGEVYLVDWGLAVPSGAGPAEPRRLEGTPAYMAPEMIAGLPVDARTDVYLLGATLHEVLTGSPPHAGRSLAEVLQSGYDEVARAYGDAPAELAALCREAMRRDPSARPASARAFRDRLAAFLSHRASAAIVRRGRALLDELGRTAGVEAGAPREQRRALLEECLVTLRLALAEWPESPSALAALDDWRRMALSVEIEEGHLAAARHLLEQIENPPAELRRQVIELERRLAREQAAADLGRRAAFEGDVRIGARERRLLGFWLTLCIVVVATFSIPQSASGTLDPGQLLVFALVLFVPFAILVAILRRRLLGNDFARRTVALLGLILALILSHRTVAWLADQPPAPTLVAELLTIAGICGMGGVTLARWWFAGLAMGLTGALLGTWNPALAPPAFTTVALLITLVGVVSWSRDLRG
jgi:serine/threonine-protein kinase